MQKLELFLESAVPIGVGYVIGHVLFWIVGGSI